MWNILRINYLRAQDFADIKRKYHDEFTINYINRAMNLIKY